MNITQFSAHWLAGLLLFAGCMMPARAATPVVTGQWDFDGSDLRASVGADLEFVADTADISAFLKLPINGQPAGVLAFGSNSINQGIYMRHGAKPNGGGLFVNQYTLIMDVMYPAASSDQWRALFQTDPFNHPGNGAEFLVGDHNSLPVADGIGTDGQFDGALAPDNWYRVAFVVDLTAIAGSQLIKYVNGVRVAAQSLSGGVDGRYALGPTALLFTAGVEGGGFTQPGFVNSIQFFNGAVSSAAVAALGGPKAGGIAKPDSAITVTSITNSPSAITLTWSGGPGPFQVQAATTRPSGLVWQDVGQPTSYHTLTIPRVYAVSFYRVKQLTPTPTPVMPTPFAPVDQLVPTLQRLRPAGKSVVFPGRPVDLALSPDGRKVFVKNVNSLLVLDAQTWRILQNLHYPASGASMHGIAVSPDGTHVYVTGAQNELYDFAVGTNGSLAIARTINLVGAPYPCGLALSADGNTAYVCLNLYNSLGVVDLTAGQITTTINVGVAPWDVVLSPDGNSAYVSNWGGRHPAPGDLKALSGGTFVVVDERGVGASGTVSFVDLARGRKLAEVAVGLHPCDLQLSRDGGALYVANANSDSVSVLDTQNQVVQETIPVRPNPALPFGSDPDALVLSPDGVHLYVAAAGNNAVAVFELPNANHTNSLLQGFFPAGWYPGALLATSNFVYVANVKGVGSVPGNVANAQGTVNKIAVPTQEALNKHSATVQENGRIPQILQTQALARDGIAPAPVPLRVGEPSVFQHVVYVIKENRCYDGILGDLPQGNGNSNLCVFPQFVTPNHHALATQYVLLDNYYCNGVISADGHSWSVEAHVTDHIEKSFGGFARSYALGTDALTYSASGFIWNNVLNHGLTFRNYGELNFSYPVPGAMTWQNVYQSFTNQPGNLRFRHNFGVAAMLPNNSTNVPGWNLGIPDVVRAAGFINELRAADANGIWEAFHVLYLPNDHTSGLTPGSPSPRAQMADNDLALGRVVEAITGSSFGSNTCIFVIEDDPQAGPDHVDGHRSLCLVISPYTKRGQTVSTFYNQAGVVHSMEQIIGLPPMNQMDAMAPLMTECFTNAPDFTPYAALANNVPLDEMNPGTFGLIHNRADRLWAEKSSRMNLSKPDLVKEDAFNRVIWHAMKGGERDPSEFAGAHGKGLKQLGLLAVKVPKDDDD